MLDESSGSVEAFRLDFDGDGQMDRIVLARSGDVEDPTVFDRVAIHLSGSGANEITGDWGSIPDAFQSAGNALESPNAYLAVFPEAGPLLFLFGAEYACCPPSMEVFAIRDGGLERYFRAEAFAIFESPSPTGSGAATMAGNRCLAEAVDPKRTTYNPVVVYRLGHSIEVDSVASAQRTTLSQGGFVGLDCRGDVVSRIRKDGGPILEMSSPQ